MMGASEQVLGTHSIANARGVFFMPNNCIPVRRKVRRSSIMLCGTPALANWVPSLDERRTLRVQQQEAGPMNEWLEKGLVFSFGACCYR
jgi:hypothetical protein